MDWKPWEKELGPIFRGLGFTSPANDNGEGIPDIAFAAIPLATVAPFYMRILREGVTVGISNQSDPGSAIDIATQEPTSWMPLGLGEYLPPADRPFSRFFIRRRATMPGDASRYLRLIVSNDRFVKGGTPPPRATNAGGDTWNVVSPWAANLGLTVLLAATPGRRFVKIKNVSDASAAPAEKYVGPTANGSVVRLLPGDEIVRPYAGDVYGPNDNTIELEEIS